MVRFGDLFFFSLARGWTVVRADIQCRERLGGNCRQRGDAIRQVRSCTCLSKSFTWSGACEPSRSQETLRNSLALRPLLPPAPPGRYDWEGQGAILNCAMHSVVCAWKPTRPLEASFEEPSLCQARIAPRLGTRGEPSSGQPARDLAAVFHQGCAGTGRPVHPGLREDLGAPQGVSQGLTANAPWVARPL